MQKRFGFNYGLWLYRWHLGTYEGFNFEVIEATFFSLNRGLLCCP